MKRMFLTALLALSFVSIFLPGCAVLRPVGRSLTVYAKRAQFTGSPAPVVYDHTKLLVGVINQSHSIIAVEQLGGNWFEVARYDTTSFDALFLDIPPQTYGWFLSEPRVADQPMHIRIHFSCANRRDKWFDWYVPILAGPRPATSEFDAVIVITDRDIRCW